MADTARHRPPFMGEFQKIGRALRTPAAEVPPLIIDYSRLEARVLSWSLDGRRK